MLKYYLFFLLFSAINLSAQQIPHLPVPLGAGSAEVYNNQIYFFGGSNNWSGSYQYDSVFVFNGSSWSFLDTIPDRNLWDVETVRVGNDVYLVSGWPYGAGSLRKFNLITHEWTYLASSPNTYTWGVAAEYYNGHIYLFNPAGNVYAYSIAANEWSLKTNAGINGPLNLSSIIYQNEIYIIGYYDSSFVKYNPAADQWTPLAKSLYQVGASAMGIINGKIYNIGGNNGSGSVADYKSVIVYDISQNNWALDSLEISSKRHWMATAEYSGGLYVLGGIDSIALSVDIIEEIVPQGTAISSIEKNRMPAEGFVLNQNYPNPFNPSTQIGYKLPHAGHVTLKIFDTAGRGIKTLVNQRQAAGEYNVTFDASGLPASVYIYQLKAGNLTEAKKMILIK